MEHAEHALLELPAAVLLVAGGVIVLALAARRAFRGETSGVIIEPGQLRRTLTTVAIVPIAGLLASAIVVVGAAIVDGRLRPR